MILIWIISIFSTWHKNNLWAFWIHFSATLLNKIPVTNKEVLILYNLNHFKCNNTLSSRLLVTAIFKGPSVSCKTTDNPVSHSLKYINGRWEALISQHKLTQLCALKGTVQHSGKLAQLLTLQSYISLNQLTFSILPVLIWQTISIMYDMSLVFFISQMWLWIPDMYTVTIKYITLYRYLGGSIHLNLQGCQQLLGYICLNKRQKIKLSALKLL